MDWNNIWNVVISILMSVGGIGGVIVIAVKFSSNIIADKLTKKYELKLSKEMEIYRAGIENKVYISKTKFDTEFELYRKLSKTFTKMVIETTQLFPIFTKNSGDDYERYKKQHDKVVDAIVLAQNELYASAPFITEDLYNRFDELETLCKLQLSDFQDFRLGSNADEFREECHKEFKETYKRTNKIDNEFNALLGEVRTYIASIDVIE